jgi:methyltransferase (TIGR00027 family)
MEERGPSRTALSVAALRAVHQRYDADPKILDDPIAVRLVPAELMAELERDPERWQRDDRVALRAQVVARSRFAEDRLAAAVARGVTQAVSLGAGYDTFAYRQPTWARGLRIVEIDAPATQRAKREQLAAARIAIPPNVAFLPVDFELTPIAAALAEAIDVTQPAFFSWLGVMMYLRREAVEAVFRAVAALPRGSEIAFSYTGPRAPDARIEDGAAALGEPWLTRTTPKELQSLLAGLGFTKVTLPTPEEIATQYFAGRHDGLSPPRRPSLGAAIV